VHDPPICTTSLFGGLDYVGCVVPGVSGMSPPACPSYTGMLSFFCVEPLMGVARSFCCVTGLGIGFFFVVVLPLLTSYSVLHSLSDELGYFLFEMNLLPLVVYPWLASYPLLARLESSIHLASPSSPTRILLLWQYLICNHSFVGSLFT
jgi:hypothetical protein